MFQSLLDWTALVEIYCIPAVVYLKIGYHSLTSKMLLYSGRGYLFSIHEPKYHVSVHIDRNPDLNPTWNLRTPCPTRELVVVLPYRSSLPEVANQFWTHIRVLIVPPLLVDDP